MSIRLLVWRIEYLVKYQFGGQIIVLSDAVGMKTRPIKHVEDQIDLRLRPDSSIHLYPFEASKWRW